jgi:hypothetical protein
LAKVAVQCSADTFELDQTWLPIFKALALLSVLAVNFTVPFAFYAPTNHLVLALRVDFYLFHYLPI